MRLDTDVMPEIDTFFKCLEHMSFEQFFCYLNLNCDISVGSLMKYICEVHL